MVVLGIDPGLATIGWAVVEKLERTNKIIDYGTITTPAGRKLPDRLLTISQALDVLIDKYDPEVVAVEELFFNTNVKTAMIVSHARGVILLSIAKKGVPLYEYTPLQVKQAVVGYGRADKNQVQQMVKILLKLREIPKPDDAADAVAVALCHISSSKLIGTIMNRKK